MTIECPDIQSLTAALADLRAPDTLVCIDPPARVGWVHDPRPGTRPTEFLYLDHPKGQLMYCTPNMILDQLDPGNKTYSVSGPGKHEVLYVRAPNPRAAILLYCDLNSYAPGSTPNPDKNGYWVDPTEPSAHGTYYATEAYL